MLKRTWPYDMWSLGVAWLELVLGTREVFQVRACASSGFIRCCCPTHAP